MDIVVEKPTYSPHNEMLLVGSLYKEPDLYVTWGTTIRSKYDFKDEATKFYYDCFELIYKNHSQTIDENKINIFMSQDDMRFKTYKHYGGYKTIEQWMNLADENDIKSYFTIVKKYSLIREYERLGFNVQKILNFKNFDNMDANDVYRVVRGRIDKINTIINAKEESVNLTSGTTQRVSSLLIKPDMGLPTTWNILNGMTKGLRLGKVIFNGFVSNGGKTRNLVLLAAYITLCLDEKFFLISNEMDENSLQDCLITTVVNNKFFQKFHRVELDMTEREITLGLYKDDKTGEYIARKEDEKGNYIESEEEFTYRVYQNSQQFRNIIKITEWIDRKKEANLLFKDAGDDYSDKALEFEFRKARIVYGIKYCGYDTLKGYRSDDWQVVKQTATKIKELMKEIDMFCWAVFQLTDDTVFTDVFNFTSNNIANAKQIKHVADVLMIGRQLNREEYQKYQYVDVVNSFGEPRPINLDESKKYFAIVLDKNRGGSKDKILLFEIDLDRNIWNEVGYLLKKR